ncbi:MAG: alpha/beta hydrolase [Sedimenticolaceae bacterium]
MRAKMFFHRVLRVVIVLAGFMTTVASAEEVQIRHAGKTLNANLEVADGKTLSDGVIVIVHALMQHYDTEIIRGLQDRFKDAGRNSLAMTLSMGIDDRRGSFECTTPLRFLFQDAVDEGLAWLAWLKTQGGGPVVMLGHSSGANQALKLTVEHYDPQISALVLLSPMTMGIERQRDAYKMRYREDLDKVTAQAKALIAQGKADQLMRVDALTCPQAEVTPATLLDFYGGEPLYADPTTHLSRVAVPMFIIAGSADERQPNVAAFLERYVDNRMVFLYTVESAGHFFRDLNLDEVAEEAIAFLDRLDESQ